MKAQSLPEVCLGPLGKPDSIAQVFRDQWFSDARKFTQGLSPEYLHATPAPKPLLLAVRIHPETALGVCRDRNSRCACSCDNEIHGEATLEATLDRLRAKGARPAPCRKNRRKVCPKRGRNCRAIRNRHGKPFKISNLGEYRKFAQGLPRECASQGPARELPSVLALLGVEPRTDCVATAVETVLAVAATSLADDQCSVGRTATRPERVTRPGGAMKAQSLPEVCLGPLGKPDSIAQVFRDQWFSDARKFTQGLSPEYLHATPAPKPLLLAIRIHPETALGVCRDRNSRCACGCDNEIHGEATLEATLDRLRAKGARPAPCRKNRRKVCPKRGRNCRAIRNRHGKPFKISNLGEYRKFAQGLLGASILVAADWLKVRKELQST